LHSITATSQRVCLLRHGVVIKAPLEKSRSMLKAQQH